MRSGRTSKGTPARSARRAASTRTAAPSSTCGAASPIARRTGRGTRTPSSLVASTTKGATAICAHLLAQRGELDLDAPVVKYWPEFGAAGKEQIPVRWLLSHQAGLPVVDGPLTFEEACAWHPVIRALEAQKPLWQPGTEHVYHAVTFGFLVGELVRRITGKSLGTFFADEVAAPLGLSAWIGLPEEQEETGGPDRVRRSVHVEELTAGMIEATGLDADTVIAWMNAVGARARCQPAPASSAAPSIPPATTSTRVPGARRSSPAANMFTDARSLARMYAATVSEVDGVRLLDPATVERMTVVQTDKTRMHGLPPGLDDSGRSLLLHVARVLAGLPADALGRARVVRPPRLGRIGRLRRPRCRCRLRLRHESVVVEHRRTAGVEPGRGGRGLPRVRGGAYLLRAREAEWGRAREVTCAAWSLG